MKLLLYGAVAAGIAYFVFPDQTKRLWGMIAPGAPADRTVTGTPAPIANPTAPTTIGRLNITGSRFGVQRWSPQNSVVS